jgi:hypothetical protein
MHCAIKAHVTFRDLITVKKEHRPGQHSQWEKAKVNLVDAVQYGKAPIGQAGLARKGEAEMVVIPRGSAIFRPLYGLAGQPVRTDHPIFTHGIGHVGPIRAFELKRQRLTPKQHATHDQPYQCSVSQCAGPSRAEP